MRGTLRRLHRWLALGCALLWLSQAITGLLMVYRWELDDALIDAPAVPLDLAALGARLDAIQAESPPRKVTALWTSGGVPGRFDVYVDGADGRSSIVRIDGAGRELRARPDGHDYAHVGLVPFAATLHQTLFAGETGHVIVGVSGLLLLSTVAMGLVLAWPRRHQWRLALLPASTRPGRARWYAWHRALGLWLAMPALLLVTMGVMLVFEDRIEGWLGADGTPAELQGLPKLAGVPIAPVQAVEAALRKFPGAELSGVSFPSQDQAWYRIRVRQPGEWRRVYGTTAVYVAASDGRVLRVEDALHVPAGRAFVDGLYPVHTGEAAGAIGRLVAFLVGAWLLAMLVLGLTLWKK